MAGNYLDLCSEKLDKRIEAFVAHLSDGGAKDFAEYRELCGAIRGLRTAQEEIKDLVRRLKENDDD
jgi:hypothetical protein